MKYRAPTARPVLGVLFALLTLSLAGGAMAECPPPKDRTADANRVIAQLQAAPSEAAARPLNATLWEIWLDAPDAQAKAMLTQGMARRQVFDLAGAVAAFSALIDYCPDYAEGWNQRAFAHYLRADFESALSDLEEALARNPRHVAALSGKALTLMGLGYANRAQDVLREALVLNPWLPERVYLVQAPPAKDL